MLNVGDTIQCSDRDELLAIDQELIKEGYQTDFMYEKDGEKGLWLVIERAPKTRRTKQ